MPVFSHVRLSDDLDRGCCTSLHADSSFLSLVAIL